MKPKRYPYSGEKKQPHEEIAIKVGDTKISVNNNSIELEAPKITVKE